MKRFSTVVTALVAALLFCGAVTPALANTLIFNPGTSGVLYSINSGGGFYVSSTSLQLPLTDTYAYGTSLRAAGAGYSDAAMVVGFDGAIKLGDLQGVSVSSTGSPLAMNLWFDTGGDGKFFTFSGTQMTLLSGDSYGGTSSWPVGSSSSFYMLGGNGAGSPYTLAQLQGGTVSGIDGNTAVAIWVGITNPSGQMLNADVKSITVTTADSAAPEPLSFVLLGTGLLGLCLVRRRKLAVINK